MFLAAPAHRIDRVRDLVLRQRLRRERGIPRVVREHDVQLAGAPAEDFRGREIRTDRFGHRLGWLRDPADGPRVGGVGRGIVRQGQRRDALQVAAKLVDRDLPRVALVPDVLLEHRKRCRQIWRVRKDPPYLTGSFQ